MEDKYSMPQNENIFIAKRLLVDNVYKSANLEGIAVTYAETNDILNNINVSQLSPKDICKICDLRDTWHYVLDNINKPLDLGFLKELHMLVAKADVDYWELGKIRTSDVLISGTSWRPELPDVNKLHSEMQEILSMECITDRAVTFMLWSMRNQIFKDGNKRVATLAANKIMIENGKGIIAVPVELDGKFKTKLAEFYNTNDMAELKKWIYDNCIDGVNIPQKS